MPSLSDVLYQYNETELELSEQANIRFTEEDVGAELLTSAFSKNHRATLYTTQAESPDGHGYTSITIKPFGEEFLKSKVLFFVDDEDAALKLYFEDFEGKRYVAILGAFSIIDNVFNKPPLHSRPIQGT